MNKSLFIFIVLIVHNVCSAKNTLPAVDSGSQESSLCSNTIEWQKTFEYANKQQLLAIRKMSFYFSNCHIDDSERKNWLYTAAELGDARDRLNLAIFLDENKHSPTLAEPYYRSAASYGVASAALVLAEGCLSGKFNCKKEEELELMERAVRSGNVRAAEQLSELLIDRSDVPLNAQKALGWLLYANRNNHCSLPKESKIKLGELRKKLSDEEFKDALAFSHIDITGLVDGKPFDGEPCSEERY